jgi:hypothetical protein
MPLRKGFIHLTLYTISLLSLGCSDIGDVSESQSSNTETVTDDEKIELVNSDLNNSTNIDDNESVIEDTNSSDTTTENEINGTVAEEKIYINPFQPDTEPDPDAPLYVEEIEIKRYLGGKEIKTLDSSINSDLTLFSDFIWEISDEVQVENGVTLTIESGTEIFGVDSQSILNFQEGSTLIAIGKKSEPIIFTSKGDIDNNLSTAGDWGGILISNSNNSILKYLLIKYAGYNRPALQIENEDSETILEYIEIYQSKGDGFQFNSGDVNLRNSVAIGVYGDSISLRNSWSGNLQNIYIHQTSNSFGLNSSGIQIESGSSITATNLWIDSSVNGVGSGIFIEKGADITLLNSIIMGERSGVCIESAELIIDPDIISNIFGNCGGGNLRLISILDSAQNFSTDTLTSLNDLTSKIEPTDPLLFDNWFDEYSRLYLGAYNIEAPTRWIDDWTEGIGE